ncbi:MAG: hypothetical protein O3A46_14255 [Candidatus Poribacteria bacterium]|nr:hypothetical protein [Candidatus Poribacteria bacterium]
MKRLVGWSLVLALSASTMFAHAQDGSLVGGEVALPESDSAYLATTKKVKPGVAFLMSAAIPGSGQLYSGKKRGFAYLAVEAALVGATVFTHRDAANTRDDFFQEVRAGVSFDGEGSFDSWTEEDFEHATLFDNWHNVFNDDGGEPIERVGRWYWNDRADFKDSDPTLGDSIPLSDDRLVALGMRDDANDTFKRARLFVGVILFNHLVSAIDARIAARSPNDQATSESAMSLRLDEEPSGRSSSVAMVWNRAF